MEARQTIVWALFSLLIPARAWATESGAKLYLLHCSVCHSEQGNGKSIAAQTLNPPPRNFRDPAVIQALTRERMRASILDGRPGTGMQPWRSQLSASEVEVLIDYIRTTFMDLGEGQQAPPQVEPGRAIYNERCYVCHGYQGNAETEAAAVLSPPPRNFTDPEAMSGIDRQRMAQSIKLGRPGTGMKPFDGVLSPAEIGAVIDFIVWTFVEKKGQNITYHSPQNGWERFAAQYPEAIRYYYQPGGDQNLPDDLALGKVMFDHSCVSCHLARKSVNSYLSPFKKRTAPPAPAIHVE